MDYPFWNELFTFSTGFSTVFVKKKRSFQRCFPPFPHSFPHPVEESPIQAVMDAAVFWKFLGKKCGHSAFYKKRKSKVFLLFLQFTPAYGFAFLQSGILPRAVFHKPPGEKNPGWKTDTNSGFPQGVFHTFFSSGKKCRAVRRLSGIALFFTSYCGTPAVRSGNRGSGCRRPRWW